MSSGRGLAAACAIDHSAELSGCLLVLYLQNQLTVAVDDWRSLNFGSRGRMNPSEAPHGVL